MKRLVLIIGTLMLITVMTACQVPERPEDSETDPVYQTICIPQEDFNFYQSTVDGLLGTKDVYMMVTPDGDVEIPNAIYEAAMAWDYEALCYRTADGVLDRYVSARRADVKPEPIIEYVDRIEYIDVPGETIYTHRVIDDNFVAGGIFYYYLNEDIVNLYYIEGNEMFVMTILYDNNIVNTDKRATYSLTYYNSVYKGTEVFGENWLDAVIIKPDGTEVEFNNITELVEFYIIHYSFNEIKADYMALTDGDPNTVAEGMWVEERSGE